MKRDIIENLVDWACKPSRKPLVLSGARQVGKTWVLKEFGRLHFKNVAYFNFDERPELSAIFDGGYEIPRLVVALSAAVGFDIRPSETLIIFDEIQLCPKALTSLKYWCENGSSYAVAAAGSLIGLSLNEGTGYPVGKTQPMTLFPMSFGEFLDAIGESRLRQMLPDVDSVKAFSPRLVEHLKHYLFVGGMPEAVFRFVTENSLYAAREVQENILLDYKRDFSKHVPRTLLPRVMSLWRSLPRQLDRTDRRFVSAQVEEGSRARDYKDAFEWLEGAGLAYRIWNVSKVAMPLSAYRNHIFKLFSVDVGLLAAQSGLPAKAVVERNSLFTEFKGALTEQFVQQELRTTGREIPYYWTTANSQAEVDFLYEIGDEIVPVEVKAEINLKAKSLKSYMDRYSPRFAVRTSLADYHRNDPLVDVPLYALAEYVRVLKENRE